jgi:isoleucyl-tRNA synthetase
MDAVREVSSVANALRKKEGRRVRLPLPRLTVVVPDAASLAQFEAILLEELNVKSVQLAELRPESYDEYGLGLRLVVNARVAGPRLGKRVQQVIQAAKAGAWVEDDRGIVVKTADGDVVLQHGEGSLDSDTSIRPEGEAIGLLVATDGFVVLDTTTTPELEAEGLARDMIRAVQDTRKAAGFDVSDRIHLGITFENDADAQAVSEGFELADVAGETLAVEYLLGTKDDTLRGSSRSFAGDNTKPEHEASFAARAFANVGAFTVAVARAGERA